MSSTVLITGCSTGIGAATVRRFAEQGWNVAATLRKPLAAPFEQGSGCVEKFALDVTEPRSVDEAISRQFSTNVDGVFTVTRAVLPHMRERASGVIINVASLTGLVAMPLYSLYAASKYAVVGFSESLSHELAPFGIRVKVIAPGAVATDFSGRSMVRTFEGDGGPYADSIRKVMSTFAANRTSAGATPGQLAQALYGAATDGSAQVRYVVGDDAHAVMQTRKEIGEEALLGGIRQRFGLVA